MAVNLTIDGVVYSYPTADDPPPWGADATDWATAATTAIGLRVKDPMTANGDIIIRNTGVPTRVGIGSAGQVLTVAGGIPAWAAPAAGSSFNLPKPMFKSVSGDTSQVQVTASATKPVYLSIGGASYTVTSNMTMDLDTSGFGGLDTGAKAASTAYYLYAVVSGGTPGLVCSVTNPDTGPTGFADWSYIGSFVTYAASAIPLFTSVRGCLRAGEIFQTATHTGNTSETAKTLVAPVTACQLYIGAVITPGTSYGTISGTSAPASAPLNIYTVSATNNGNVYSLIHAPVPTTVYLKLGNAAQTIYCYFQGWNEDPQAWK